MKKKKKVQRGSAWVRSHGTGGSHFGLVRKGGEMEGPTSRPAWWAPSTARVGPAAHFLPVVTTVAIALDITN